MTAIVSCEGVYQFYAWRGDASSSELKQDTLGLIPRTLLALWKEPGNEVRTTLSSQYLLDTQERMSFFVVELFSEEISLH